ncbi:hypothetical protein DL95DRAFT_451121 [Leptodontidium sp. 2 PMI_412]|nr:hypothetical protein DL95DRAFT_451121 [Leptodontidium sp. 2 PMI_412]
MQAIHLDALIAYPAPACKESALMDPAGGAPPEADYTLGFGSFDFFPYDFDPCPRYVQAQMHSDLRPISGDTRPWSFPFMKLPLGIRNEIYKILLARLYGGRHDDLHKDAVGSGIVFRISDGQYHPGYPEVHYDLSITGNPCERNVEQSGEPSDPLRLVDVFATYEAMQNNAGGDIQEPKGWIASRPTSAQLLELSESTGEDVETSEDDSEDDSDDLVQPPTENYQHRQPVEVTIARAMDPEPECSDEVHDSSWRLDDCNCYYRTPADYDFVRDLSQVSPHFTRELGACLWENATLDFLDPAAFFLFFKTRPAIVPYIGGVVLNIQCHGDLYDILTPVLAGICDFASKYLKLRSFTVRLSTILTVLEGSRSSYAYQFADSRINEWKEIFRNLKIERQFDVRLDRHYPWVDILGESEIERLEQKIRDLWLPDSVRQQEAEDWQFV